MNKDKWTQQLHDKLADREVAAPDDLWADIEAALPKAPMEKGTPKSLLIPLRRWAIAASVVALMAGGGYLWWKADQPKPSGQELAATTTIVTPQKPDSPQPEPERLQPEAEPTLPELETPQPNSKALLSSVKPISSEASHSSETLVLSDKLVPAETSQESSSSQASESVSETANPIDEVKEDKSADETIRQLETQIAMLTPKSGKTASVSLYASNGLSNQRKVYGVRMSDELAERYDLSQYMPVSDARTRAAANPIYLVGYEERQKHYQPLSFGLSVGYPLSSRLSLSTGLVYTRLRSDFTSVMSDVSILRQQTLHYLGIPLNVQYHLWHSGGLNVYLSTGAETDYNIKAKMVSKGVEQQMDRDRWQFSMQGAVGIQYDVLPQLGLYAEPGVKYYFDNGSSVRNFFKDKSLNFNLQVGLRLNITK